MHRVFSWIVLALFSAPIAAQTWRLEPAWGLDNSRGYSAYTEQADASAVVRYRRERMALPVYALGVSRQTRREHLQTYNLHFTLQNAEVAGRQQVFPDLPLFYPIGSQNRYRLAALLEQLYRLNPGKKHHQFYLGFSTAGAYESFAFEPRNPAYFPESRRSAVAEAGGTLRYQYQWGRGWTVLAQYSVSLLRAAVEYTRVENPNLTSSQQKNTVFELELSPRYVLRFGVGIPLNPTLASGSPNSDR